MQRAAILDKHLKAWQTPPGLFYGRGDVPGARSYDFDHLRDCLSESYEICAKYLRSVGGRLSPGPEVPSKCFIHHLHQRQILDVTWDCRGAAKLRADLFNML